MDYLKKGQEYFKDQVNNRRYLHQHPEIGFELPNTVRFVKEKLAAMDIEAFDIGDHGVTALIGNEGGKTILLRADMDALPITEKTNLDFAATNDKMHACGHDIHTSMLLGAARMLKENEENLQGQIKLIFQPAEELLTGGKKMVEAGILEKPKVDVAIGMHVWPTGKRGISTRVGTFMAGAMNFRIKVEGKGAHGAIPHNGVDPVYIGANIVTGVQELLARELPMNKSATITMGKFIGQGAVNVIPDEVEIEGTIRTFDNETRTYVRERFVEIVQDIAKTYRGKATVEFLCDVPVLVNHEEFGSKVENYLQEINEGNFDLFRVPQTSGSEDFAYYANEVPSMFYLVNMPNPHSEVHYNVHHPKVIFDEKMMPVGSATIAHVATRWLEEN